MRYPGADTDAVSGVSFEITEGQTIALVGENGSGKTSVARLLGCLYAPTSGRILWDGIDTADLDPVELRAHIATVAQEYGHWPFSAEANIRIGRPDSLPSANGQAGIEAAAVAAGAHDMIMKLPKQYKSLLDTMYKGGIELSGGQWQKMSLARAVYRDSHLMLCDEPSAALDPRAEATIFSHLKQRNGSKSTVLITHRLANVRHADLIIVLHEGRQIETGTHDELMALRGLYENLFSLQASGYTSEK